MALGYSVEEDEDGEEAQRRPCSRGQIKGRNFQRTAETRSPSQRRATGDWVRRCPKVSHDAERSYTGQDTGDCYSGKRGKAEASLGATAEGPARTKAMWSW